MNSTLIAKDEVSKERGGRYAFINFAKLNDAHDEVRKGLSALTQYADAFRAFADLFKRDCDTDVNFSSSGADGFAFICAMLSSSMYEAVIDLPYRLDDMREAIKFDHASKAWDEKEAGND